MAEFSRPPFAWHLPLQCPRCPGQPSLFRVLRARFTDLVACPVCQKSSRLRLFWPGWLPLVLGLGLLVEWGHDRFVLPLQSAHSTIYWATLWVAGALFIYLSLVGVWMTARLVRPPER